MNWLERLKLETKGSDQSHSWKRLIAIALCVACFFALQSLGGVRAVDNHLRSIFFQLDDRDASGEIVLVDIDADSLSSIGVWPWPRSVYAEVIDKLAAAGAAEIAFDVDFSAESERSEDQQLERALEEHGGIMLASFAQRARANDTRVTVSTPLKIFAKHAWPVLVNVRPDPDGRIRTMTHGLPLAGEPIQSLASSLAYSNGVVGESFVVDFGIRSESLPRISVIDVLNGDDLSLVDEKRVLIGANAVELRDFFLVPRKGVIAGHELQAIAAETLIQGRAINVSNTLTSIVLAALIGIFAMGFILIPLRAAMLGIMITGSFLIATAYILHVHYAYSLEIAASLFSLVFVGIWRFVREHDIGSILLSIWKGRAINQATLIESVVAESVEGVLIVSETGIVLKQSRSASGILGIAESFEGSALAVHSRDLADLAAASIRMARADAKARVEPVVFSGANNSKTDRTIEAVSTASCLVKTDEDIGKKQGKYYVASLMFRDITDRVEAENKIRFLATHHHKTGLLNRSGFLDALSYSVDNSYHEASQLTIACFKVLGLDTLETAIGHDLAGKVVQIISERISESTLYGTEICALEDSIFAVAFLNPPDKAQLHADIEAIIASITAQTVVQEHTAILKAYVGYAGTNDCRNEEIALCMKRATTTMHKAQQDNLLILEYSEQIEKGIIDRQRLEVDLRKAVQRNEFFMQYQPLIDLKTGCIVSAEALVRWQHPERGIISPDEFVPLAEEVDLVDRLSICVLNTVCRDISDWPSEVRIAVNLSPTHMIKHGFVNVAEKLVLRHGLSPERFELEVTESAAAEDPAALAVVLRQLRALGFSISLDDFGTGYSSLSYLRELPLDKLKIDRAFVHEFHENDEAERLVRAITGLARALNLRTVLEGIETERQANLAKECGVTYGQGYYFAKPMNAPDLEALLLGQTYSPAVA